MLTTLEIIAINAMLYFYSTSNSANVAVKNKVKFIFLKYYFNIIHIGDTLKPYQVAIEILLNKK